MKFNPCNPDKCTDQGDHCEGCGRSHEEIAETKVMVTELVCFAQKQAYENNQDFVNFVAASVLKKL